MALMKVIGRLKRVFFDISYRDDEDPEVTLSDTASSVRFMAGNLMQLMDAFEAEIKKTKAEKEALIKRIEALENKE